MTKHNPAMRNALNTIRNKVRTFTPEEAFPSVNKWQEDGVDHINIGYNVKTELGNLLSLDSPLKLKHSIFGHFETVENFRLYIQTEEKDDRLRYARVVDARKMAKAYKYKRPINLHAMVMDSVYSRIKAYPRVAELIVQSELPFENYYIHPKSGIRIRPRSFSWLIPGFEEIRVALKEGREPNFDFLKDRKDAGIYDFTMPEKREIPKNTAPSKKIKKAISAVKGTDVKKETPVVAEEVKEVINFSFDTTATGVDLSVSQETLEEAVKVSEKEDDEVVKEI